MSQNWDPVRVKWNTSKNYASQQDFKKKKKRKLPPDKPGDVAIVP